MRVSTVSANISEFKVKQGVIGSDNKQHNAYAVYSRRTIFPI